VTRPPRITSAALRRVDARLTYTVRPLDLDVDATVAQERLMARLAGLFGAIAVLLSAIGLYGVTSSAVTRRRGEIGIRLALGGQAAAVLSLRSGGSRYSCWPAPWWACSPLCGCRASLRLCSMASNPATPSPSRLRQ
jgi:hypothetical protein